MSNQITDLELERHDLSYRTGQKLTREELAKALLKEQFGAAKKEKK